MPSQDFQRAKRARAFSIQDKVAILYHNSNPTIIPGYDAPPGSILLVQPSSSIGEAYAKVGLANTDWVSIIGGQNVQPIVDTILPNSSKIVISIPDTILSINYKFTIQDSSNITSSSIVITNSLTAGLDITEYAISGNIYNYSISLAVNVGNIDITLTNASNSQYTATFNEISRV